MVLVTREGSAAREGLLAVGVWALVWSLSRVDATMSGERTRVTEGLMCVSEGLSQNWRTYLSTTLTHVRLLAGVDALVDSQCGSLDELLAAVGVVAHVGADATVDTFCREASVRAFWC